MNDIARFVHARLETSRKAHQSDLERADEMEGCYINGVSTEYPGSVPDRDPSTVVNRLASEIAGTLFGNPPSVSVLPADEESKDGAQEKAALVAWYDETANLPAVWADAIKQSCYRDRAWVFVGWTKEIKEKRRTGSEVGLDLRLEEKVEYIAYEGPMAVLVDQHDIFPSPGLDPHEPGAWVVLRQRKTWNGLWDDAQDKELGYDLEAIERAMEKDRGRKAIQAPGQRRKDERGEGFMEEVVDSYANDVEILQYWGPVPPHEELEGSGPYVKTANALIEVIGDETIRFIDNPMPHKRPPFEAFYCNKVPGMKRGVSIVEEILPLVKSNTEILNQTIVHNKYAICNILKVKKGVQGKFPFMPGAVWFLDRPNEDVVPFVPAPLASHTFAVMGKINERLERITSVGDPQLGIGTGREKTATSSAIVEFNFTKRIDALIEGYAGTVVRIYRMIIDMCAEFLEGYKFGQDGNFREVNQSGLTAPYRLRIAPTATSHANQRALQAAQSVMATLMQDPEYANNPALKASLYEAALAPYAQYMPNWAEIRDAIRSSGQKGVAPSLQEEGLKTPLTTTEIAQQGIEEVKRMARTQPVGRSPYGPEERLPPAA